MLSILGMPSLPGSTFRDVAKDKYPKPQTLMTFKGISMLNDRIDPRGMVGHLGCRTIGIDYCPSAQVPPLCPSTTGLKLPPWIEYDRKVLTFNAYFTETLQGIYYASFQVRKVKIQYYLEDGTIKISEPKVINSGIPQGRLLRRQRIRKPPPCQMEFISILDLNVDTSIQIFDRVYHITSCDNFTRYFLTKSGIPVPDPVDEPVDPSTERRKREGMKLSKPVPESHTFAELLARDKMVLKFYGYWDDYSEFDDVSSLELCYFLADDTIDIKDYLPQNSGREEPTIYLQRTKLPKECTDCALPGQISSQSLLDAVGIANVCNVDNMRCSSDTWNVGHKDDGNYKDEDLKIGTVLNVNGRALVLTDCNKFTENYYKNKELKKTLPSGCLIESYFEIANDQAICTICSHALKSDRVYNLKTYLIKIHKIKEDELGNGDKSVSEFSNTTTERKFRKQVIN